MFSGAISINIDNKGRIAIPTRYRESLADGMICTIGLYYSCLSLYPADQWKVIETQLATLSSIVDAERRIKRLLLGYAAECYMDNNGRILIPSTLRKYAKLEKNTILVGQSNKFEIWDELLWYQQIGEDIAAIHNETSHLSENLKNLTI